MKALEEAIYKEKCPFKPSTSSSGRGHKHGEGDDQDLALDSDDEGTVANLCDYAVCFRFCR